MILESEHETDQDACASDEVSADPGLIHHGLKMMMRKMRRIRMLVPPMIQAKLIPSGLKMDKDDKKDEDASCVSQQATSDDPGQVDPMWFEYAEQDEKNQDASGQVDDMWCPRSFSKKRKRTTHRSTWRSTAFLDLFNTCNWSKNTWT